LQIVAGFAAIQTLYVAMRLPGIGVPLDRDEGACGYIDQMIREGKLPYRDCLYRQIEQLRETPAGKPECPLLE